MVSKKKYIFTIDDDCFMHVLYGEKVPLYSAGGRLSLSSNGGSVPLTLDFDLISQGYVIGAKKTKPIRYSKKACSVYKV